VFFIEQYARYIVFSTEQLASTLCSLQNNRSVHSVLYRTIGKYIVFSTEQYARTSVLYRTIGKYILHSVIYRTMGQYIAEAQQALLLGGGDGKILFCKIKVIF